MKVKPGHGVCSRHYHTVIGLRVGFEANDERERNSLLHYRQLEARIYFTFPFNCEITLFRLDRLCAIIARPIDARRISIVTNISIQSNEIQVTIKNARLTIRVL